MLDAFRRFMYGRYGVDQMTFGLFVICLLTNIISLFTPYRIDRLLSLLYYFCFVYGIFRVLSRNYEKRRRENEVFLRYWKPIETKLFPNLSSGKPLDRSHRYYTCKNCKQKIRVPRGKGKIEITCPRCKYRFVKRT